MNPSGGVVRWDAPDDASPARPQSRPDAPAGAPIHPQPDDDPAAVRSGWAGDAGAAAVVLLVGAVEIGSRAALVPDRAPAGLVVVLLAAAVLLSRRVPAAALATAWVLGLAQVALGLPLLLTEGAVVVVAFACARWGSTAVVWLAAFSVPVGASVMVLAVLLGVYPLRTEDIRLLRDLTDVFSRFGGGIVWLAVAAVPLAVLGAAWLAGLALRFSDRATTSRAREVAAEEVAVQARVETGQALEIARLHDEQARLARDVHDVVGHSLAVILAQAESAQFVPDDDPARLKIVLATIAGSARGSLQDVRHVLSGADDGPPPPGQLQQLVEGARDTGFALDDVVVGHPRPLPPELAAVAHRVLQEMLTNAIRHGRRETPLRVEQHWPDDATGPLVLQVRNVVAAPGPVAAEEVPPSGGRGVDGMRRRLEAVGGRLAVARDDSAGTWTATAWVPVRA